MQQLLSHMSFGALTGRARMTFATILSVFGVSLSEITSDALEFTRNAILSLAPYVASFFNI